MKISLFVKTFLMLLISFSFVFILNTYLSNKRFLPLYLEANIKSVKSSILANTTSIENGVSLSDTSLMDLSSETAYILYKDNHIIESVGPVLLVESQVVSFVINIYDDEASVKEGRLIYNTALVDDIYQINYIYQFELGSYLIIRTNVQSLRNIDKVLNAISLTESIYMLIAISLLSVLISIGITRPLKQISVYAKDISNLNFKAPLKLKRNDEFRDLVTSLNEMTFNLKKSYAALNEANQKLSNDIEFEKKQEAKKKSLILTINHELKTPLAVMKGMIEGMVDGVGRYKDKDTYLLELLKQIDQIEDLTKDLTYSLKLEDKIKPNDFTSTVKTIEDLGDVYELAKQHDVKISQRFKATLIKMNDELFLILIKNLLKNAVLYTTDKQVSLLGEIISNDFVLTIRNKGFINDEDLSLIFDPFFRSNNHFESVKGTGLGLSIVKQICELYGYNYKIFNDSGYVVSKIIIPIKN